MPHTIRLRGPWELEPLERFVPQGDGSFSTDEHDLPAARRCQMPADWGDAFGKDFQGAVRHTRTFNRPTNLDPHEKVWLHVEPPRSCGVIHLNGQPLGRVLHGEAAKRFEITQLLQDFNRLTIEVRHPELDENGHPTSDENNTTSGGLIGEVKLEITDE